MGEIQTKFSDSEFEALRKASENKIILLQDISTKNISCSKCYASADNSVDIKHKDCCEYKGGKGC